MGPLALAARQSGSSTTFHLQCYWPGLATTVSCLESLTWPNWSFCVLSYYSWTYSSCDSERHLFKILRGQTLNPTRLSHAFRLKWPIPQLIRPSSQLIRPSPSPQPYRPPLSTWVTIFTIVTVASSFPVQGLCTCCSFCLGNPPLKSLWLAPSCQSAIIIYAASSLEITSEWYGQSLCSDKAYVLPHHYSPTPRHILSSLHLAYCFQSTQGYQNCIIGLLSICFSRKQIVGLGQIKP